MEFLIGSPRANPYFSTGGHWTTFECVQYADAEKFIMTGGGDYNTGFVDCAFVLALGY